MLSSKAESSIQIQYKLDHCPLDIVRVPNITASHVWKHTGCLGRIIASMPLLVNLQNVAMHFRSSL